MGGKSPAEQSVQDLVRFASSKPNFIQSNILIVGFIVKS